MTRYHDYVSGIMTTTITDVLDIVPSHEIYSFLDNFSGYNQIQMNLEDQEKTMFIMEWGVFVAVMMMFGLKTVHVTF